jgi:hypothetical protein
VERALRVHRGITGLLAALALAGCLAAFQSPQPEIVRAQRFEAIDAQGRTVGAFGSGIALSDYPKSGDAIGWYIRDPESDALAVAGIGECTVLLDTGEIERYPTASLELRGGTGCVRASASAVSTDVGAYFGEDLSRSVAFSVRSDQSAITLEAPNAEDENARPVTVLKLSHESGKATIQGWDDHGNPTLRLE